MSGPASDAADESGPVAGPQHASAPGATTADTDGHPSQSVFPERLFADRRADTGSTAGDGRSVPRDRDGRSTPYSEPTEEPSEVAARIVADVLAARGSDGGSNDAPEVTERLRPPTRVVEREPDRLPVARPEESLVPEPDGPPPPPAEALAAAEPVSRPVEEARLAAQPLEDEDTRFIDLDPPPRTGRWLLTTVIAALALAVLFPLAIAALRQLAAMS